MANEAILRDRFSDPVDFTCYDTPGMLKGTLLKLSGARLVGACSADNDVFIGVLARDKISGDGRTQVPVYVDGIFDMYCDANVVAITPGVQVTISGANIIKIYTTLDEEKGYVVGRALEAGVAGSYGQVILGR